MPSVLLGVIEVANFHVIGTEEPKLEKKPESRHEEVERRQCPTSTTHGAINRLYAGDSGKYRIMGLMWKPEKNSEDITFSRM